MGGGGLEKGARRWSSGGGGNGGAAAPWVREQGLGLAFIGGRAREEGLGRAGVSCRGVMRAVMARRRHALVVERH